MDSEVSRILILILSMWSSFVSCNYFPLVHFRERKFKLFAHVEILPANLQMLGLFAEKYCLSLKLDCDSCKDYKLQCISYCVQMVNSASKHNIHV